MIFCDNFFNSNKIKKSSSILFITKTDKDHYYNKDYNIKNAIANEIFNIKDIYDVIIFVNIYTSLSNDKCNELLQYVLENMFSKENGLIVYINELVTNFSFHPMFTMKNFVFNNLNYNFGRSVHIDCFYEYIRNNDLKIIDVDRIYSYSSLTYDKEYFSFICKKKLFF